MLLTDLMKEFQFDMECKKFSTRTIKTALNNTKAFIRYAGLNQLEEITHLHIKQYISYLQGLGRTEVYVNGILKNMRIFYRYCEQKGYIIEKQNHTKKVKWAREPKVIINTFSDSEAVKMLNQWDFKNYYNDRNKAIVGVFFETGIRNLLHPS